MRHRAADPEEQGLARRRVVPACRSDKLANQPNICLTDTIPAIITGSYNASGK